MQIRRRICRTSVAAFLAFTAAASQADTFVWDPNNDGGVITGNGLWDLTTANWLGAPSRLWPNEAGVDADIAVFGGSAAGPYLVTLGAPIVANGLIFDTDTYTITDGGVPANTLTLSGTAPTVTVSPGLSAAINASVAGAAGLTKGGLGTLTLGGVNTYGGVTTVTNGVLSFSASVNLGGAAAGNSIAVSNNATLRFTGATAETLGTTRALAVGSGGATIEHTGTGVLTLNGAITAATGATFTKSGSGTLLLTGASPAWNGNVVVDGGTLQVGNVAGTQFINGLGASVATRTVTINSGATIDFLGRDATGGAPPAFIVNGGTIRNTAGFTRLGNLTLNGGTITVIQGNSATFQAMTFNGDVTVVGTTPSAITTTGGTFNGIHLEKTGGVTITVPDITGDAAADLSIATPLLNITSTSAANGFIKNGVGTLVLTGANTFTGTMTINDGNVTVNGVNAANPSVAFSTVAGGTPVLTTNVAMKVANITQNTAGNPGLINGNASGSLALNGDRTLTINDVPAAAVDLLIGVPVTNGDTTARAVTKVGPGVVQFDGVNTFTGNLNINEGTVIQNATQSAAGNLVMGSTAGVTPRLTITATAIYRLGNNPSFNPQANGSVVDGAGSLGLFGDRAFNIFDGPAADDLVLSAALANGDATTRNWRKEQTGRMVMQGNNTFTGNTDVYRGTLVFDYSINNGSKAPDTGGVVGMRGGALILSGNVDAPTTEVVPSISVPSGAGSIQLMPKNGQTLTFNLGGITRTVGQGLIDFRTTNAALTTYQTTATNNAQGILGPYATFNGNRFAMIAAGAIGPVGSTVQNDPGQWQGAQNIVVDSALTGTLTKNVVNSLVLDAPAANTLALGTTGGLTVRSGGLVVTANVGANNTAISGGQLGVEFNSAAGGAAELVVSNFSTGTFTLGASVGANNAPLSTTETMTLGGTGLIDVTSRNFYTGATSIMGRVRASGGNAFSDYGTFTLSVGGDMTTAGGAVLDLNGASEGIGSLAGGAFNSQGQSEIQLGIGGTLTINGIAGTTYQGLITGSGTVIKKGSATQIMTTNPQTYTGEWQVLGGLTDFTSSNTGLTSVTSVLLRGGSLLSEQNQGANVDKLNNAAVIHLEGTTGNGLRVTSNQNGTRTETVDRLDLNAGSSIITLTNTSGGTTFVTAVAFANATDAFTRNNNATLLVRSGVDLGGTPAGAGTTRITFTSGITGDLVGGVGGAGTTTIPILPFAVGGNSSLTNAGDTFVTVGANGMRPLAIGTEYATNFATAATTDNLSQNATATGLAGKTVNSLRVDNSAGNVDLTGSAGVPLTLTSGALLVSAGANTNATTIGGFDAILAGANDANPDELVVHVTTSNATPTTAALTINSVIANNGAAATSLTKSGGGTLTLGGTNTYTGTTTINQGVLQFTAAANLGVDGPVRLAGGTLTWSGTNTTDISSKANSSARTVELLGPSSYVNPVSAGTILNVGNRFDIGANNVTLAHAIGNGGVGGLTKVGTGTLTLGEAPTYTGPTFVREGGMNFPTIAANTTSALYLMSDTNTSNVTSTVTSGLNTQSLIVGAVFTGTGNSTGTLTVNGGAVNIGDGSGDDFVLIGYRDNTATSAVAGTTRGTVNFQTATSVNINVARVILGQTPNSGSNNIDGDLNLSNGTNVVTANQIIVGNSPGPGNTGATVESTIALGTGSTTFNVDSFTVGGQKTDGAVTLGTAGTFTLRGVSGGTSSANVFIGDNDAAGTGTVQSSTLTKLDLSAGTADVRVNLLVIGRHAGNGTGTGGGQGSLIFNAGTVQAQTIQLGMSDFRGTSTNHASTVGVITQNGGTMRFQDLSKGTGVGTYNWNGGTIGNISGMDLTNQNMTIGLLTAAAHTVNVDAGRSATFQAGAGFSGAGSLTKTGNGLLALNDASVFTGGTSVQAGLLQANNATGSALGTGAISVAVSGTLGGTGSVSGAVTVGSGGTLAPGAGGIESLGSGALAMNAGSTFALEINTSSTTNDLLASTGSLTLDLVTSPALALTDLGAGVPLAQGTALPFITYNGTWNNGLFSVGGLPIADDTGVFTFGPNAFSIDYNFGGNSVALVAVPEPGTAALLLGGLASVVGMRRRKRS